MTENGLWFEPLYQQTVAIVMVFLVTTSALLFWLQKQKPQFIAAWATVRSWTLLAPFLLFLFGLPDPYFFLIIPTIAGYSTKAFYLMVGMYHRTWFVWINYIFILTMSYSAYYQQVDLINLMPMCYLFCCSLIPLFRNSFRHTIQYISLSLLCFVFLGWSLMYLGLILKLEHGVYTVLFIFLAAELSYTVDVFYGRYFGKIKLLSKINSRITLEGYLLSVLVTLGFCWSMSSLLPTTAAPYWPAFALIISTFGRCGELIFSVIRKDLGIKGRGIFVIGHNDLISRVDKYIFLAPIFYYSFEYLKQLPYLGSP